MTISASKTARVLLRGVAFCAASWLACSPKPAPAPVTSPPRDPPARSLVVAEDRVTIGANVWVEMHARLAAAARSEEPSRSDASRTDAGAPALPFELGSAVRAYRRTLAHDDGDELLAATLRGLARCGDDACAFGVLEPTGFGEQFRQTLPWFVAREWDGRAQAAWHGVERIHEVAGPRLTAVLDYLVQNLGTTIGPVAVVDESPPSGNTALLEPALGASGPCFHVAPHTDSGVQKARLLDCVAVRAALAGDAPLRAAFGERLWTVVVVHTVAALVTTFEPKHVSVDRRAVALAEPEMLAFVTKELHSGPVSPELAHHWKERAAAPADSASH